ncbi:glycerophosphodiester phosphodiesterase [Nocardioides taihuensis]|uniref:Glycerophosphodiester phosphodiesterase n=1 Tax=Nocardioides taihuensis TaxID=1835606 RepID=A0ABW0BMK0_9ACTN
MTVHAIAHRAGNSLAGLRAARTLGVDVIECDVREHRGRLEVRHLKTAGPLPLLWDTWELVPASAPRLGLAELLDADHHDTTLMLDVKGRRPSTAEAVARQLHDSGIEHPIWVCGRWWPAIDTLATLDFVRPVLSARNRSELGRLRRRLADGPGVHGVSVHASLLDEAVVAELDARVEVVMSWPVNDVPLLGRLLGIGVNGIISDEPDVLAELLRRRAGS